MAESMREYLSEGVQSVIATSQAMLREGAKDLHNAIVPAFPDAQRGVDEPGLPTTPTSREVYEQKNQPEHLLGYAQEQGPELARQPEMER